MMEKIFGVRCNKFCTLLFSEPLKLLKIILTYWWLNILYRNRRLDIYDPQNSKDLTKLGIVITDVEKRLEQPECQLDAHTTDSILIFGANSAGDYLVARVCRELDGQVAWLMLELAGGYSYQLPYPDKSYPANSDFMAGGLRIKCSIPSRRWRVSFNGLLKRVNRNEDEKHFVHMRFSFICISTSFIFDAFADIHPTVMASYLANETTSSWLPKHRKVTKYLNKYIQSVSIIGTWSVDGSEETELNFWGVKHRSRDTQTCRQPAVRLNEYLCYTKDGQMIYSGSIKPPSFKSTLQYGHFMERCGLSTPVKNCHLSLSPEETTFNGMKIDLTTDKSFVSVEVNSPRMSVQCPAGLSKSHSCRVHLAQIRTHDGDTGHALILESSWAQGNGDRLVGPSWNLFKTEQNVGNYYLK